MAGQLAAPRDPGVQPGAPGFGGLRVGPGAPSVWVGTGLGVQVALTGLGLRPDRPGCGGRTLELSGVGEGMFEWLGGRAEVLRSWVPPGCERVMASGRCE